LTFLPGTELLIAAGYDDGAIVVWPSNGAKANPKVFADYRDNCEILAIGLSQDSRRAVSFSCTAAGDPPTWDERAVLLVWNTATGHCQAVIPLINEGWRVFWVEQIGMLLKRHPTLTPEFALSDPTRLKDTRERTACLNVRDQETEILNPATGVAIGWIPIPFYTCQISPDFRLLTGALRNQVYIYRVEKPNGAPIAVSEAVWLAEKAGRTRGYYMDKTYIKIECRRRDGPMPFGESRQRPDQKWIPGTFWAFVDIQNWETSREIDCPHCGECVSLRHVPSDRWTMRRLTYGLIGVFLVAAGVSGFLLWRSPTIPWWFMAPAELVAIVVAFVILFEALLCDYTRVTSNSYTHRHTLKSVDHTRPERSGIFSETAI
jgi:hypothetical protein